MSWRTGRTVLRTVYENDQIMFLCTTPEEATRVVELLNKAEASEQIVQRERALSDQLAAALVAFRDSDRVYTYQQAVDMCKAALTQHAAARGDPNAPSM